MTKPTMPQSLKTEHDELHQMLINATHLGGKTGDAAKAVSHLFHVHAVKEELYAMPALAILPEIVAGNVTIEMESVINLVDQLKKELPQMLEEHRQIKAALNDLRQAALDEQHPIMGRFIDKVLLHAKTEEEVIYPAALLVGEYLKIKLNSKLVASELYP